MYRLKAETAFDSAHFLSGYAGKCRNIHGHRWRVIIEVEGRFLIKDGVERDMLVDFGKLKRTLREEADLLDHALIYEEGSLKDTTVRALKEEDMNIIPIPFRPTAENFAKYFYDKMAEKGYNVSVATVYETPDNCAIYMEDR